MPRRRELPPLLAGFAPKLALVVIAGLLLRAVYALWFAPPTAGIMDAFYFKELGRLVADGHGFSSPHELIFRGRETPTAEHPPLYSLVLALEWKLGISSDAAQRATGALLGAATIALVGLVGRRVGGERVGLVAAGLAAAYPLLVSTDGALLSETLYLPLVALALLAAYRLRDRPSAVAALALGAAIGAAVLTRGEALLLLPLLAAPAAWGGGEGRVKRLAACCLAAAVVVAPWVARNWVVFDRLLLSNNVGGLVAQTNCRQAYSGPNRGGLVPACLGPRVGADEAEQASHWHRKGAEYARGHLGDLAPAAAVRLLRTWGLWQPLGAVKDAESRNANVQRIGIAAFYLLAAAAVGGAVALRRRREPLALLLAPVIMVSVVSVLSYGNLRLRAAAEVPLVLLAAVGLVALRARLRPLSSSRDG